MYQREGWMEQVLRLSVLLDVRITDPLPKINSSAE